MNSLNGSSLDLNGPTDIIATLSISLTRNAIYFPCAACRGRANLRALAKLRGDGEGGHVTTERVRQEERQMLAAVKDAWDKCPALIPGEREIQDPMVKRSANQSGAARFLWTSGDMVMDVSGIAGAGKTTLLREVVPALLAEGIWQQRFESPVNSPV